MLLEIFDPKAAPRPIGIDLGTTNSLVARVREPATNVRCASATRRRPCRQANPLSSQTAAPAQCAPSPVRTRGSSDEHPGPAVRPHDRDECRRAGLGDHREGCTPDRRKRTRADRAEAAAQGAPAARAARRIARTPIIPQSSQPAAKHLLRRRFAHAPLLSLHDLRVPRFRFRQSGTFNPNVSDFRAKRENQTQTIGRYLAAAGK